MLWHDVEIITSIKSSLPPCRACVPLPLSGRELRASVIGSCPQQHDTLETTTNLCAGEIDKSRPRTIEVQPGPTQLTALYPYKKQRWHIIHTGGRAVDAPRDELPSNPCPCGDSQSSPPSHIALASETCSSKKTTLANLAQSRKIHRRMAVELGPPLKVDGDTKLGIGMVHGWCTERTGRVPQRLHA